MRITPQNKTEVNALEWAIQGLAASGWDSAEEVAHACDIDDPELDCRYLSRVEQLF